MTPSCTEGTDEQQYLELLNEFSLELELLNANRRQTSEDFDQQSQHLNQQIEHLEQQIASRSVSEQQCLELLIEVRLEIVLRNANLRQIIEDFEQQIEPFEQQIGHLKQQIESLSVAHQSTKK